MTVQNWYSTRNNLSRAWWLQTKRGKQYLFKPLTGFIYVKGCRPVKYFQKKPAVKQKRKTYLLRLLLTLVFSCRTVPLISEIADQQPTNDCKYLHISSKKFHNCHHSMNIFLRQRQILKKLLCSFCLIYSKWKTAHRQTCIISVIIFSRLLLRKVFLT